MDEREQRDRFDARFATEAVEITVLTGEWTRGTSHFRGDALHTGSADVLAYVDEEGQLVEAPRGHLTWLVPAEPQHPDAFEVEPRTQYTVQVRRLSPDPSQAAHRARRAPELSHYFALDAIVERDVDSEQLRARLARWSEPRVVHTRHGPLELYRRLGFFHGTAVWCGHPIRLSLDVDEGSVEGLESCTTALARFEGCAADDASVDQQWRTVAATTLLDLANHWNEPDAYDDPPPPPVTVESFVQRIRLADLAVGADGSLTPSYDDGNLFLGHAIQLSVAADGTVTDADMVG